VENQRRVRKFLELIDYTPRDAFLPYHKRQHRWAVIVAHRRAGKTVATINDLVRHAIEDNKPDGRYAYVAPLFNQAKDVAWTYLKRFAEPALADWPNETELRVDLYNGCRVRLYGADNPDRLRGLYLDGVVLDEFADMAPVVWHEVVRPALSDRKGFATFIGTPKGKNAFWDLWRTAETQSAWFALMLKASGTGLLGADELAEAREQMGEDQYAQEYECSFEAAIKGAFYAEELRRATEQGRIGRVPVDRAVPVHTGWDLGVSDSTAIWFIQCVGRERRLVDYHETSGVGLDHYARVLEDKRREHRWLYGQHFLPHDIAHRELSTGLSRVDTLRGLGIDPEIVREHNVLDGINAVRRMLDRTFIDAERCIRGLEALRQYRREWDITLKDWRARPLHDWSSHGADALRTFAAGFDDPPPKRKTTDRQRRSGNSGSAWVA
jgi:phage terminase large subunit